MLGVIGDLVQDIVVWQRQPVQHATDTRCRIWCTRGGSAANVAAFAAARVSTRFIGCVGEDGAGDEIVAELGAHGVDVCVQRRGRTGRIVVLVDPDGERHMFPDRGAAAQLGSIDPAWLTGIRLLHVPAYGLVDAGSREAIRAAVVRVRAAGGALSIDASSAGLIRGWGVEAMLGLLAELAPDFLSANADEAGLLGLTDAAGGAGPRRERLPRTTVLARRGARPTRVLAPGKGALVVPVAPVAQVRDATGAGDAFNAGFLACRLDGGDLRAACLAGHALAARALRSAGARLTD